MQQDPIIRQFALEGEPVGCALYGNGHINESYLVQCSGGRRYILQRINKSVFHDPESLMNNVRLVTDYLLQNGGDRRTVLTLMPTRGGAAVYRDTAGEYWRVYDFLEGSICLEAAERPEDLYESGFAFGAFQRQLLDFDAAQLVETIPYFHDTPKRFEAFRASLQRDVANRVREVGPEAEALLNYEAFGSTLIGLRDAGELPVRVTHNDTKLNNVLLDAETRKALCVIDLDTVMPGLAANDFGEVIRTGASTAAENEKDLDKVRMDIGLYETCTRGFFKGCGGRLTALEMELMPVGAKMMALENSVRFLKDYVDGDTYYRIHYPTENLDRARSQLKLVREMERQWGEMDRIAAACLKEAGR